MPGDFLVTDPDELRAILQSTRTIAVVGLSSSPQRPSHDVATYLASVGYRIVPVNPNEQSVLGERAYPTLDAVPADIVIDLVDVFRRSNEVAPHVEEAIRRGTVKCLWLQDGVVDWDAAQRAHDAGLKVVMDDCTLRRHRQLIGRPRT
jgi:predicted CoA-binding protein